MKRLLVLALFVCFALVGCASRPRFATLRVMTYNIHHGEGTDGKIDLERIAKLITDNKIDVVALQEVDRNTQRTGHRDMPAELARLTGMHSAFGSNLDLEGGHYGNAILSRFPISWSTNIWLPKVVPGEQRGILITKIAPSNFYPFLFANTHLDHRREEADRLASVASIQEIFREFPGNFIIAGDFNTHPGSEAYRRMKCQLNEVWSAIGRGDGFTIPSEKPTARIDYIWFSKTSLILPRSAWVIQSNASDHLPLVSEFIRAERSSDADWDSFEWKKSLY